MAEPRSSKPAATPASAIFLARQPIFSPDLQVFGYELLFRDGFENSFNQAVGFDFAASRVLMDSFTVLGMDTVTGGKRAFINFTENLLLGDIPRLFPHERMVVEILEMVNPTPAVVEACRRLKQAGYLLAVDDFVYADRWLPLLELVDIVKVDVLGTSAPERRELVKRLDRPGVRFLAEKVETREMYEETLALGYTLFQGYFFSKPVILTGRDIPGFKLNYLNILREVYRPELDFDRLEGIIKADVALTFKLLRFINSAAFSLQCNVDSIRQALTLLGTREIRKWVSLVTLSGIGDDKTEELLATSIVRGRFCELLAPRVGMTGRASELFLVGVLSLVDAFLDAPMPQILAELPIDPEVKAALSGSPNRLRGVLDLVTAYERAEWDDWASRHPGLLDDESAGPELYQRAMETAWQFLRVRR